jgi:predicted amidophosphoribosyltransferase
MCGGHRRNIGNLLIPLLAQVSELSVPVREPVIQNRITCPNCSSLIAPGYSWCPDCGTALRPQPCNYCGQTLAPKDKHCQHCGAPRELVKNR